MRNEEEKRKKKSGGLGEEFKKVRVRMEKERRARMSEGIVRAVFFCVFSVFSIKKNFDAKQKCAEKTRRERSELSR